MFSHLSTPTSASIASIQHNQSYHSHHSNQNLTHDISKVVDYIKYIKKSLDALYKDLIQVITSEEFEMLSFSAREKKDNSINLSMSKPTSSINSSMSKPTAKELLIIESIPDKFVKLEKKVNDIILNIQEYIWYLEEKYHI